MMQQLGRHARMHGPAAAERLKGQGLSTPPCGTGEQTRL